MSFSECSKAQMDGIQWGKEIMPGVQHTLKCNHRKVENTVRRLLLQESLLASEGPQNSGPSNNTEQVNRMLRRFSQCNIQGNLKKTSLELIVIHLFFTSFCHIYARYYSRPWDATREPREKNPFRRQGMRPWSLSL